MVVRYFLLHDHTTAISHSMTGHIDIEASDQTLLDSHGVKDVEQLLIQQAHVRHQAHTDNIL